MLKYFAIQAAPSPSTPSTFLSHVAQMDTRHPMFFGQNTTAPLPLRKVFSPLNLPQEWGHQFSSFEKSFATIPEFTAVMQTTGFLLVRSRLLRSLWIVSFYQWNISGDIIHIIIECMSNHQEGLNYTYDSIRLLIIIKNRTSVLPIITH